MKLEEVDVDSFLERFDNFEDGVITGISIVLPRYPNIDSRKVTFEIQARDAEVSGDWRMVHISVFGLKDYRIVEDAARYSLLVLSDGLRICVADDWCLLDLDPGPGDWSPSNYLEDGEYSRQFAIGNFCNYDVLDGPYI
ncbi:hypothetical protein [Actinocorallia herbida]|uniref:hypothetical protein n=1 Tax=Actinocorallia herbida TaxID=58109 RepID=UPI0011CDACF9|nr:hypothetical protein [Actinocorallia herbida]